MAHLHGFTVHAVDLPGLGLSAPPDYRPETFRRLAVTFVDELLVGLGIDRAVVVGQSIDGAWATWTTIDRPERVTALVLIACPAGLLGTSAPLPFEPSRPLC